MCILNKFVLSKDLICYCINYNCMDITFSLVKSKEIVNVFDGKRLGRAIDVVFNRTGGKVLGIIVPTPKKMFKKSEDIFIPLELIKKIGEDVILVKLTGQEPTADLREENQTKVYARYRRVPQKER